MLEITVPLRYLQDALFQTANA